MTTQIKSGSWYVDFWQQNRRVATCLHQIRVIDYRRLSNKLGEVEPVDYQKICVAFRKLYF